MADAGVLGGTHSRSDRVMERLKTTAGVVAAVAGAVTGMWTIYEKAKSNARAYTTASYETLAPQVNQVTEALRKIEQENQQLRAALLARSTRPTRQVRPGATTARPTQAAPAAGAPAPASEPATATSPGAAAEEKEQGALDKLMGTMHQTREAVEAVRKVPETFQKVLEQRKK